MPAIVEKNSKIIQNFMLELNRRGLSERRKTRYKVLLNRFKHRRLDLFAQKDADDFLTFIRNSNYSPDTKISYWALFKKFMEWHRPDVDLSKYRLGINRWKKFNPDDMLSAADVARIIQAADNVRDRAIMSLLFDTGCRPHELLGLHRRDVCFNDQFWISLDGKTGPRTFPVVTTTSSDRFLRDYLSTIPEGDDNLFSMTVEWLNMLVKAAAKKAGVEKKHIYPYLFRHSRATYLANKLTESQLKVYFGWTQGSKMAGVYVHLSGRDLKEKVSELNEKLPREASDLPKGELLQEMFSLAEENKLLKKRLEMLERRIFEDVDNAKVNA